MQVSGLVFAAAFLLGCAGPADPVRNAIDAGDRAALQKALAGKPSLEPVCGPNDICKPLAAAASRGDLGMVVMLIEAGADPNGRNAYDDTAYMLVGDFAKASGLPVKDVPAIRTYLLEHGTDPNQTNQFDANVFGGAAAEGDIAALELSLKHGGLINRQSPKIRYTPLMAAAQFGEAESVRWLLAHGANPGLRDSDGRTARAIAEKRGHAAVAALLPPD